MARVSGNRCHHSARLRIRAGHCCLAAAGHGRTVRTSRLGAGGKATAVDDVGLFRQPRNPDSAQHRRAAAQRIRWIVGGLVRPVAVDDGAKRRAVVGAVAYAIARDFYRAVYCGHHRVAGRLNQFSGELKAALAHC